MFADFLPSLPTTKISGRDVILWLVDTRDVSETEEVRDLLCLLSDDEKARMSSFRKAAKQRQFLLVRAALRLILNAYIHKPSARDITFITGEYGKPRLADNPKDLQFNISHSGFMIMIAVSQGRNCGVDIEAIKRNRDIYKLAEFYFHPSECSALTHCGGSPADLFMFYRLWTLKEAFIKADGKGMAIPSKGYYFRDPDSAHPSLIVTEPSEYHQQSWFFGHGTFSDTFSYAFALSKKDNQPVYIYRRKFIFPQRGFQ